MSNCLTLALVLLSNKKGFATVKRYRSYIDIKVVFSSFNIGNMFGVKDPIPCWLRTCVVDKFLCAGCNACYVGETSQHLSTRVREHLVCDRASNIFRHLENSQQCYFIL